MTLRNLSLVHFFTAFAVLFLVAALFLPGGAKNFVYFGAMALMMAYVPLVLRLARAPAKSTWLPLLLLFGWFTATMGMAAYSSGAIRPETCNPDGARLLLGTLSMMLEGGAIAGLTYGLYALKAARDSSPTAPR